MKLKNKLTPLVAFASTAAVVTPLVTLTACKNTNFRDFDLVNDEIPAVGASQLSAATRIEATKEYINYIKNNPEKFANDYATYLQKIMALQVYNRYENYDRDLTFNKYNISISNPTIGSTYIAFPGEEGMTYPTISFTLKMSIDMFDEDASESNADTVYTVNTKQEATIEYNNIPFYVYSDVSSFDEDENAWFVGCDTLVNPEGNDSYVLQYMQDAWSLKLNVKTEETTAYPDLSDKKDTTTYNLDVNIDSYEKLCDVAGYNQVGPSDPTGLAISQLAKLQQYVFHFQTEYLSSVEITNEVISNASEINLCFRANETTTNTVHPVEIGGLSMTNSSSEANAGTYKIKGNYSASIGKWSVDSDHPLYGSTLYIKDGAELTVDNYGRVTIGSATATAANAKVYIQTQKAVAFDSSYAQYTYAIEYNFPKNLTIIDEDEKENIVPTNVDTINFWFHANPKITTASTTSTMTTLKNKTPAVITADYGAYGFNLLFWSPLNSQANAILNNLVVKESAIASNLHFDTDVSEAIRESSAVTTPYVYYEYTEIVDDDDFTWTVTIGVQPENSSSFTLCLLPEDLDTYLKFLAAKQEAGATQYIAKFTDSSFLLGSNRYEAGRNYNTLPLDLITIDEDNPWQITITLE